MFVLFWHRMILLFLLNFSDERVYWTSIANLFARQRYEQKRTEKGNCDWNDSGDGGRGGASGTFDWDPFVWRYLWCFHLKIIRSAAQEFFSLYTHFDSGTGFQSSSSWQHIDNFQCLIFCFFFFVVIIFHFAKSHRAFNFYRSHTRNSNDGLCCARKQKNGKKLARSCAAHSELI